MNLEKLKELLVKSKIYKKENSKNFICKCINCKDHPDPQKQGHLYISKNPKMPVCHCWFCGYAVPIPKMIFDLTGDKQLSNTIISEEEIKQNYNKSTQISPRKKRFVKYKIPTIDISSFPHKEMYLKHRTNNSLDIKKIPGLILNFLEFFKLNNLDIVGEKNILTNLEADFLQQHFIGFLSEHNTTLYCRNCDPNSKFKFKKVVIQNESYGLLDYWSITNEDPSRTIVILTEGAFNIIGEYISDSLKLKDKIKTYASGNTFSYGNLLKSVCLDNNIYKASVIILSDNDKTKKDYHWFLKNNSHIISDCKIFINKSGKDFGIFPQVPIRIL